MFFFVYFLRRIPFIVLFTTCVMIDHRSLASIKYFLLLFLITRPCIRNCIAGAGVKQIPSDQCLNEYITANIQRKFVLALSDYHMLFEYRTSFKTQRKVLDCVPNLKCRNIFVQVLYSVRVCGYTIILYISDFFYLKISFIFSSVFRKMY